MKNHGINKLVSSEWLLEPETDSANCEKEFDMAASDYDECLVKYRCTAPQEGALILQKYVNINNKILDVGCGSGVVGERLLELGYHNLYGMDISEKMLAIADKKNIYKHLERGDIQQVFVFEDACFDACIIIGVFSHVKKASFVMKELIRITKPNGYIIFSQREDLFTSFKYGSQIEEITADRRWIEMLITEPVPYIPGLLPFSENKIAVRYYVFQTLPSAK